MGLLLSMMPRVNNVKNMDSYSKNCVLNNEIESEAKQDIEVGQP